MNAAAPSRRFARALSVGMLLAVALLFGLWWLFVRATPPDEVCRHIVDVTMREAGEGSLAPDSQEALVRSLEERCVQHKLDKIQLRGRIEYARYAKCVMGSDRLMDIERC